MRRKTRFRLAILADALLVVGPVMAFAAAPVFLLMSTASGLACLLSGAVATGAGLLLDDRTKPGRRP